MTEKRPRKRKPKLGGSSGPRKERPHVPNLQLPTRPDTWHDSYYVRVYEMAVAGLPTPEIARGLGVQEATLTDWTSSDPILRDAIDRANNTRAGQATHSARRPLPNEPLPTNPAEWPLTPSESLFVQEWLRDKNAQAAGVRIGLHPQYARELLGKPSVALALVRAQDAFSRNLAETTLIDAAWCTQALLKNYARALQETAVLDREGNPIGEYRWDGPVANRAIELIAKLHGLISDQKTINLQGRVEHVHAHAVVDVAKLDLPIEVLRSLRDAVRKSRGELVEALDSTESNASLVLRQGEIARSGDPETMTTDGPGSVVIDSVQSVLGETKDRTADVVTSHEVTTSAPSCQDNSPSAEDPDHAPQTPGD